MILRLHEALVNIVSDWDSKFTSTFWIHSEGVWDKRSQEYNLLSTYKWSEDYSELKGYIQGLRLPMGWKFRKHRPLIEFTYIDNYHSSIEMDSTRLFMVGFIVYHFVGPKWGERHELELLMVQETVEQMDMLKDWL